MLGRERRDGSAVAGQRGLTLAVGAPIGERHGRSCRLRPAPEKYPSPMTDTRCTHPQHGHHERPANRLPILSTTSGYLRVPVPEVHRSRTAKSSTSNTKPVARRMTAASQVVPPRPVTILQAGHRRLACRTRRTMRLSGVCYRPAARLGPLPGGIARSRRRRTAAVRSSRTSRRPILGRAGSSPRARAGERALSVVDGRGPADLPAPPGRTFRPFECLQQRACVARSPRSGARLRSSDVTARAARRRLAQRTRAPGACWAVMACPNLGRRAAEDDDVARQEERTKNVGMTRAE